MRRLAVCAFVAALCTGAALARAPGGPLTEFVLPMPGSRPYTITPGPDGNLWFTESDGNRIGRISPAGQLTEFAVPTPASGPYGIAAGSDGNLWFTERFADQIGRITPQGVITEFVVPTPFSQPWEIVAGPDGNLWFTEEEANQIGRITLQGAITEFPTGTCCFPTGIAAGADGNLWFTIEIGDQIGRMTPSGASTLFQIETVQVLPWDIAAGPDGAVWFTELAGRSVGRITPAGEIDEFPIPGEFSGIAGIAAGPDGNLWFTENDTARVGVLSPQGEVLGFFETGLRPLSITSGPDGNLWFTEADANAIGRLEVAPPGASFALSLDAGFAPRRLRPALGSLVQWTFLGPGVHSVNEASGLGRFASGTLPIVSYFTAELVAAGRYAYRDEAAPGSTGVLDLPVALPDAGTVGVPFTVTWASEPPPGDDVFDVLVRTPFSTGFQLWLGSTQETGASYTPSQVGPYLFRARMRDPGSGAALGYSGAAGIQVESAGARRGSAGPEGEPRRAAGQHQPQHP